MGEGGGRVLLYVNLSERQALKWGKAAKYAPAIAWSYFGCIIRRRKGSNTGKDGRQEKRKTTARWTDSVTVVMDAPFK